MASLAEINLQKIDDCMATVGATSEELDKAVTEHVDKARAALAAGDEQTAVAITRKILERLEKQEKGSGSSVA
ncbi:hypothetical protein ACFY2H_40970 [Streptomyces griseofuscus]|uniref:hypothetical protein n=1 Tax=Streptomyces griseofuscus TaxID=146922 RepID=UPI0036A1512F